MLKQRVLTALVIAPLIVLATLFLPTPAFAALAALIFALGAWEWAGLSGLQGTTRFSYTASLLLLFGLMNRLVFENSGVVLGAIALGLVWWSLAFLQVVLFPNGSRFWTEMRGARPLAGGLVLIPALTALVVLHGQNPSFALLVIVLVAFADIGAYFSGRAFGRHKLAPRVSPGKTWEGLGGAVLVTGLIGYGAAQLLEVPAAITSAFVMLCVATVLVSVLGDLVESMFKRLAGAKDSGGLLPGHGGVLDRIDSVTAAAPLFAVGLLWLQVSA